MRKLLACFLLMIGLAGQGAQASTPPSRALEATITTSSGRSLPLTLEIAATPVERQVGLMFKEKLAPYEGMIFLFPDNLPRTFWMKNTPLSLDMLFVDAEGKIVNIEADTTPYALTHYASAAPVPTVIEIEGGRAAREGIAAGDVVRYSLPHDLLIE